MDNVKLEARSLCAGYTSDILTDVSFAVRGGEIMTVIGPNGSGKSTLLKTLAMQLPRRGGHVYISGADADKIHPRDRAKKISVLLTERVNASLMTCREVVEAGRYPYTGFFGALTDNDREAASEAIRLTGSEEFAERDFNAVSDGQRQRILLARAICQQPEVLILDEPSSYLDLRHKIAFMETVRRLAAEKNTAVIMSMHELDMAREISDSALCLKDGRVFCMGGADDVFTAANMTELFDVSEEMFERYINTQSKERM